MRNWLFILALITGPILHAQEAVWTSVDDINPFIGTGGHGHTHPSAQAPFGMIQLGPNTRYDGWDGCSGYHFTDTAMYGFTCTHLSGTGVSDYGDLLMLPYSRPTKEGAWVGFDKASEVAEAGYYRAKLDDGTVIEATAGDRIGQLRFAFPDGAQAGMMVDLNFRDRVLSQDFTALGGGQFQGARISEGWAREQHFYFAFQTFPSPDSVWSVSPGVYWLAFPTGTDSARVHVAMSGTSEQGAWLNFEAENALRPFEAIRAETVAKWSAELAKSKVKSALPNQRAIFATALYHAYSVPNLWSDADGSYRGQDNLIYRDTVHRHYTVFSLWDTYRTAHPLYTITQPERTQEFVYGMLDMYKQRGRLPIWELAGNETDCMIGYHSVSVLADAIAKGYHTDTALTLEAMRATAEMDVFGLGDYMEYGYLAIEDESESVSKTLEYAYDDACIAWTAERFEEYGVMQQYLQRASAYRSLIDPETGLVRPRSNGDFLSPYNPREVNNHFTEANAFQYSFSPVHDLEGWMEILVNFRSAREGWQDLPRHKQSGTIKTRHLVLEDLLDQLFYATSLTTGRQQADITGMMGQYAHGNEPSHHIAYLYNATDNHRRTSYWVHRIIGEQYQNAPDGLSGNEDCGQMSAWYVMASMGMYPLVPGRPEYQISTPIWDAMHLELANGKTLDITCEDVGTYIMSYDRGLSDRSTVMQPRFFTHEELLEGGHWKVVRGDEPSDWAKGLRYATKIRNWTPPAPIIRVPRTFTDEARVEIIPTGTYDIWQPYRYEGVRWKKDRQGRERIGVATESGFVTAVTPHFGFGNHVSRAYFNKRDNNLSAQWVVGHASPQYTAGGPNAVVDGLEGDVDWRKGHWVGVQGHDAALEIVLKEPREVNLVQVGLLKDIRAWIALPSLVQVEVQYADEDTWHFFGAMGYPDALAEEEASIQRAPITNPVDRPVAKLRITLSNAGRLPEWHPGAGGQSYFFIDEIHIEALPEE